MFKSKITLICIICCITIFFSFRGYSQELCKSSTTIVQPLVADPLPANWQPTYDIVIQVAFHQYVESASKLQLTPAERQVLIGRLNQAYLPARIQFVEKPNSFQYAVNANWATRPYWSWFNTAAGEDYFNPLNYSDAIDIYLVKNLTDMTGALGISSFPDDLYNPGYSTKDHIILSDEVEIKLTNKSSTGNFIYQTVSAYNPSDLPLQDEVYRTIIVHEMGHVLNLYHTHQSEGTELVERVNCDDNGDYLCDTPAEPWNHGNGLRGLVYGAIIFDQESGDYNDWEPFAYHDEIKDGNGNIIDYLKDYAGNRYHPDWTNFMSYGPPGLLTHFTTGQAYRMRKAIANPLFVHLRNATVGTRQVAVKKDFNGADLGGKLYVNTTERINSGAVLPLPLSTTQVLRPDNVEQTDASNTVAKFKNWNGNSQNSFKKSTSIDAQTLAQEAKYFSPNTAQIKVTYEGIPVNEGKIQVKDPYLVNSNYDQPYLYNDVNVNSSIYTHSYNSLTIDKKYQIKSAGLDYFLNWNGTTATVDQGLTASESFITMPSSNSIIQANYKGHLRTNLPNNSDAKNQRRALVITESGNQQGQQVMVYESMGHVWVTASSDGINWCKEERLSGEAGGSNPSISNTVKSTTINPARYSVVVTWQSGNDLLMQSLTPIGGTIYWGWGLQSARSASNFISLSSFGAYTHARYDSRPVTLLELSGNNIMVTTASEAEDNGIQLHTFTVPFQGTGVNSDIGIGVTQLDHSYVSSLTFDQYPVFISTPAVYGYAAKKALYYLGSGYASGRRIVEYNIATAVKTVLPTAYGDYTYTYLQGAVSEANATAVLVAGAQVITYQGFQYNVNLYGKATYTTGVPSLSATYTNYTQATVAVQPNSGFGSVTPTNQIYMKSTSSGSWYKANGASTIGTNISGFLMPEKFIQLSSLNSVVNRTSIGGVVATPSVLERYQNSSGTQLNKTASSLAINVRGFRFFTPINESEQMTILDFSGSKVEIIDSLESGKLLVAVKVIETSDNGVIVTQTDSLKTVLSVDVVRNGNSILSYSASEWSALTSQSIGGLISGDILLFRLPFNVTSSWGYEEINFEPTSNGISKESSEETKGSELKALEFSISAYPNPFNPQTTFKITLPTIQFVTLEVYNMLGQKVQTLANGKLEAGEHNFQFNGTHLATGTYIYRLVTGEKVQSGKIVLMK